MIPKIIHQIFFEIYNKKIEDFDCFLESKKIAERQEGYKYILWDIKTADRLIKKHYSEYYDFYKKMRFDIQRVDFIRFCILHKYGGFYLDLDMLILKSLDPLTKNKYVFHNIRYVQPNYSYIENDFIGSVPSSKLWLYAMSACVKNYNQKKNMEIYDIWKGRFVLQTTGPKFLARVVKKALPKYKPKQIAYTKWSKDSKDKYYVQDFKTNSWVNDKAS